jgi:hypothetical protein
VKACSRALQSFRCRCSIRVVAGPNRPLMESGTRSECAPAEVSTSLLRRTRFAVSPCLGYAVFLQRAAAGDGLGYRPRPLVELALSSRVLPSVTYPTAAAIRSSHGLWLPTAHEEFEVHLPRAQPARYGPPSGFGYPLGGLLPRIPGRFYFAPAALLGFTLRRFPLPRGFRSLSTRMDPPTVSPAVSPPPKRQTGPKDLGFWGHASRKCLVTARVFKPTITGASLGFRPSRACLRRP